MTIYSLKAPLNFGKYKGDTVQEIINNDPDYLAWAIDEIEGFELDEEAELKMEYSLNYDDRMLGMEYDITSGF